jgi:hypothetical protein
VSKAVSGAFDYYQYVFPHACALEAERTQGARETLSRPHLAVDD